MAADLSTMETSFLLHVTPPRAARLLVLKAVCLAPNRTSFAFALETIDSHAGRLTDERRAKRKTARRVEI
jgi:hypothetical protein